MNKEELSVIQDELKNKDAKEVLAWALEKFCVDHVALSSSLSA